jgi:hypothetical protein
MTTDTTLSRLRAANPFVAGFGSPDETDALFDRIVSLPVGDRRPRRVVRGRRAVVLVAAAFVAAVVASTAFALSHWVFGDVVPPPVTLSEYARAQELLTLPPGYQWPKLQIGGNSVTNRGAGGSYAIGLDQTAWECYWATSIKQGDAAGGGRAQRVLGELMAHRILVAPNGASENWAPPAGTPWPGLVYADDGGYEYKQRMYADAAAGKPALLAQSCRANWPGP